MNFEFKINLLSHSQIHTLSHSKCNSESIWRLPAVRQDRQVQNLTSIWQ